MIKNEIVIPKDKTLLELELEWAHNHPLWQEVKDYVNFIRPDIIKQLKHKK